MAYSFSSMVSFTFIMLSIVEELPRICFRSGLFVQKRFFPLHEWVVLERLVLVTLSLGVLDFVGFFLSVIPMVSLRCILVSHVLLALGQWLVGICLDLEFLCSSRLVKVVF